MDKLPPTTTQRTYEYVNIYKIKFGAKTVLKQLSAHCFIYNCHKCFKPWNNCYCYCLVCKTCLKYCHQIVYDEMSTCDDDLNDVIQLGFDLNG